MKLSKTLKDVIVNEINFVVSKMKESAEIEKKIFYFSAIPAEFLRVLNLEYDPDILYIHHIVHDTHVAFQQRIAAIKRGDTVVPITNEQMDSLEYSSIELGNRFKQNEKMDDILREFVVLSYSTSGNGYYLMQKGFLKI
ncbi:MAG: hypothetical protein J7K66_04580 [Anaerolineaceae bacterium]|nr:hypothetical protein [Anaerolineaceae bacterium]